MSESYFEDGDRVPIAPCVRCGRFTEDPTRDILGEPMPEELFNTEGDKEAVCSDCRDEEFGAALEQDFMNLLESKLGLAERHRDALRAFIETVFTDPEKILKLERLNDRVGELEREIKRLWRLLGVVIAIFAVIVGGLLTIVASSLGG